MRGLSHSRFPVHITRPSVIIDRLPPPILVPSWVCECIGLPPNAEPGFMGTYHIISARAARTSEKLQNRSGALLRCIITRLCSVAHRQPTANGVDPPHGVHTRNQWLSRVARLHAAAVHPGTQGKAAQVAGQIGFARRVTHATVGASPPKGVQMP